MGSRHEKAKMMSGMGSMHLFELLRIQAAESGMSIIGPFMILKTLDAGNKPFHFFGVIEVVSRLKRRHGTNPTWRIGA